MVDDYQETYDERSVDKPGAKRREPSSQDDGGRAKRIAAETRPKQRRNHSERASTPNRPEA